MSQIYRDIRGPRIRSSRRYEDYHEPEYVPLPPKLPPKDTSRSQTSDDEIPLSSHPVSFTPSDPQENDEASVDSGLEIDPFFGRQPREARRRGSDESYSRVEDRDQAPRNRKSLEDRAEYPVTYSEREGRYIDERIRERHIDYDDDVQITRYFSHRDEYPKPHSERRGRHADERTREQHDIDDDDEAEIPRYYSHRDDRPIIKVFPSRSQRRERDEAAISDMMKGASSIENDTMLQKQSLEYLDDRERAPRAREYGMDLEGREKRALEQTQRDKRGSTKYEEVQNEDEAEELRFQALEQREQRLAEREAILSQDLLIERKRRPRERKAVTTIPDPSPTRAEAYGLELTRQDQTHHDLEYSRPIRRERTHSASMATYGPRSRETARSEAYRTSDDQVRRSISSRFDNVSPPRWDAKGPTLSNKKPLPRQDRHDDRGEPALADINSTVRKALSYGIQRSDRMPGEMVASIEVKWGFYRFLELQFEGSRPRVGSILTLTGSVQNAQATTCDAYVQSTWPASGSLFNALLQNISDLGDKLHRFIRNEFANEARTSFDWLMPELSLQITLKLDRDLKETLKIKATGPIETVEELVQQLAWAGAVFSSPPQGEDIAYTRPVVVAGAEGNLFLDFDTRPIRRGEASCWLPLFSGACIASGFPVPPRHHEYGLEIPLHILAALVGAGHAVEYGGGIVIKGFSRMIIPIRKTNDIVQWHLISATTNEQRLSYREGLDRCGQRALLDKIDFDCLRDTRAILGWCTTAECALGSRDANYDIIDYSRAIRAEAPLSLTGGTLGLQQFAVGQLDFRLGAKDGKCHFQRTGPYLRIVNAAEKTPVVLYDTSDRRGWLVTAAEVILHMCHHRNHREPFEVDGESVYLPGVEPGRSSARGVLLGNAQLDLYDPVDGRHTLKDMALNCWSLIEFLIDQNVRRDQAPGAVLQANLVGTMQGYEYMAIVDERSPFQRKQSTIAKSSGGWLDLIQDIDALVLFASGFEEIMRPKRDENFEKMCTKWHRVPKEKDYLAASVKVLKDLYDVAGCRRDRKFLTSTHLQWHRGNSTMFESCVTPQAYRCNCDRLQQILPGSAIGRVVGPGPLIDNYQEGAVIFGQSESRLVPRRWARDEPRVNSIYGQANTKFVVSDVDNQRGGISGDEHTYTSTRNPEDSRSDTGHSLRSATSRTVSPRDVEASMRGLVIDSPPSEISSRRPTRSSELSSSRAFRDLQQNETWSFGPRQADVPQDMSAQGMRVERQRPRVVRHLDHGDSPALPLVPPRWEDDYMYELHERRPAPMHRNQYMDDSHDLDLPVERDRRRRDRDRRSPQGTPPQSPTRQYAPIMLHSARPSDDYRDTLGCVSEVLAEDAILSEPPRRRR